VLFLPLGRSPMGYRDMETHAFGDLSSCVMPNLHLTKGQVCR